MKLSVIVPTYNRASLLGKALQSLLEARIPDNLGVCVFVVDNNSADETKEVFESFIRRFKASNIELHYLFEGRQGKSYAVNSGISASECDLISILDDDMQISSDWYEEIEKIFRSRWEEIDFIGGKVLPLWETEPPEKLFSATKTVIAIGDHGEQEWQFGKDTPILSGGHSVIKKEVFNEIGLYPIELGPSGKNLIGCEDDVFYHKILEAGKSGIYDPQLTFYHFVPQYRLTKAYYQQWCFGVGKSWSLMDSHYRAFNETKILAVPRYLYRELLVSIAGKLKAILSGDKEKSLEAEKMILVFSGFFYAKNIENTRLAGVLKKIPLLNSKIDR